MRGSIPEDGSGLRTFILPIPVSPGPNVSLCVVLVRAKRLAITVCMLSVEGKR
jgi:hypothetical protein